MSHKIASINVNGIRAAASKSPGFHDWLRTADVDIVLLQEVRATPEQAQKALAPALAEGWNLTLSDSAQKGRAGVAILTTQPVADVHMGVPGFEDSGRFVSALVDDLFVASLYLPTGSAGTAKQDEKYRFLDSLEVVLADIAAKHELSLIHI